MVNNKHGGKHKHLARKHNSEYAEKRVHARLKTDIMEHYGYVKTILGNGHFDVLCDDEVVRRGRIPGAFKKKKRDNYLAINGFVLIGKYEFETKVKGRIEKCDLLETYSDADMRIIIEHSKSDDDLRSFFSKKEKQITDDCDVIFAETTDDDIVLAAAAAAASASAGASATAFVSDEIDFNDI